MIAHLRVLVYGKLRGEVHTICFVENLVKSVSSYMSGLLYHWLELVIVKHSRYIGGGSPQYIKVYVKITKYNNGSS